MRSIRSAALGASLLAVIVAACTTGGGSTATSGSAAPSEPPASAPASEAVSLASTLVLGGPAECPKRPFCAKGLEETYGLTFKEFKPLDVGGPITVQALKDGQVDVGLLFTSDPAIAVNEFVLLQDDKQLQLADNIVPVVRQALLDADPSLATVLNDIMAKLDQDALIGLNKAVGVDKQDPEEAAKTWLTANGFLSGSVDSINHGRIKIGSTNFTEQEILGELFAQALAYQGWQVEKKFQLGNREIVFPALESGQIDVLAEYAATVLEHVNKNAGEASTDAAANVAKLAERLAAKGLTALNASTATDQNGFVVTRAIADTYGLTKISDLAKPAP